MSPPIVRYAHTHDGMNIALTESGEGFPLIKLPGGILNLGGIALREQEVFRLLAEGLEVRFRLIEFDHRGQGRSTQRIDSYTLDDGLADLEAVVNETRTQRFILFGAPPTLESGIRFAAEHPKRVAAIIAWDPFPWGREPTGVQATNAERLWNEALADHSGVSLRTAYLEARNFAALDSGAPLVDTVPRASHRVLRADEKKRDPREWIGSLTMPIMIVQLRHPYWSLEDREHAASLFPAARRIVLPGGGAAPVGDNLTALLEGIDQFLADSLREAIRPSTTLSQNSTSRENDVLRLVAAGHANSEIAAQLFVSESTVARHLSNIYSKLAIHNRAQATAHFLSSNGTRRD